MNSHVLPLPQPERRPVMQGFWKLGVLEWFLIIQLLAGGLVLLPGADRVRLIFRALPYLVSLALLLWSFRGLPLTSQRPACHYWLLTALAILGAALFLNPSNVIGVGGAQFIYQLSIAAPLFWVRNYPVDYQRTQRLIWILFLCSALSTVVGALQVYFPDTFMPKDVDAWMSSDYVASLTYEGANGKMIMRPPGLTDLAGGAAGAAVLTATLGLVLMTDATTKWWQRILCGVLTMVGFFVLYLTQIRSAMMGLIAVIFVVIGLRLLKKRFSAGIQLAGAVVILVALAFVWAVGIGGAQVSDRFFGIIDEGVAQSYKKNRGAFVADTFMDVLPKYPFGGAAGEWGIIGIYFYHTEDLDRPYAEIQITGWVYDGGLPLLVCYSGAILFALLGILKFAWKARTGQDEIVTQTILCVNLSLALGAFAGPTFNTQLGMLFWFLTAVLYQQVYWRQRRPAPSRNHWRSQPAALRGAQMHRHAPFGGLPHGAFQALL